MRILNIMAVVPALLLACGVKVDGQGESTGEASSSSGGGTDGVSSTPTTGSIPDPSGDPSLVTMATDSADPSAESGAGSTQVDTGATEGESSGGGSTGVAPSPCEALCDTLVACGIEVDPDDGCAAGCEAELDELRGDCRAVTEVEHACFAGLACDVLDEALHGGGPHPCVGASHDVELACGPESCNVGGGGDEMGSFCQLNIDCPNQPALEMKCDMQTCTCTEDGVMTGSCDAAGVCDDLNTIAEFAPGCCGFPEVDL